jgi:hypothetical protein
MTDANRLAALEAVAEAARLWARAYQSEEGAKADVRAGVFAAITALDALPAPAQAQGETVEVAVWRHKNGAYGLVQIGSADDCPDGDFTRLGTTLLPIRVEGGGE